MAKLVIVSGTGVGKELPLEEECLIGRQPDCDIVLAEESVSRKHARIFLEGEKYYVEDLDSTNGTFVNGKLIERSEVRNEDVIATGNFMFTFHTETQRPTSRLDETIISVKCEEDKPSSRVLGVIDAKDYDLSKETSTLLEKKDVDAIQRRISTVNRIARTMATILDMDEILERVLDDLFEIFSQAERGFILLLDEDTGELLPKAVKQRNHSQTTELQLSRTILATVMDGRKSILSSDAAEDDRFKAGQSVIDLNIHSVMCAPILYQNEILGVVHLDTSHVDRHFTHDDLSLLTAVASQAAMVMANARMHQALLARQRIEQDLRFAQRVQRSFLPAKLPQVPGYAFKTYYTAAYEVGGDFYDVIETGPGKISVAIGDVAGKGVSAALMMAHITSQIRSCAFRDLPPEEVLATINADIDQGLDTQFVTVLYATLDTTTGGIHFANGGHPPPALRKADGSIHLFEEPSNLPVGVDEDVPFNGSTFSIEPGEVVFLYTDGVIEAMNAADDCYGIDRMVRALADCEPTPEAILNAVLADVRAFTVGAKQSDDLTMVAFSREIAD